MRVDDDPPARSRHRQIQGVGAGTVVDFPQPETDGRSGEIHGVRETVFDGLRIAGTKVLNRLRIDQLRGEGLSWREIARKMDLPKSTVYQYRGLSEKPVAAAAN